MAEYFPLLDRAVSGLPEQTAEARRSIYERARTALLGQLSGMQPPVPDEDIARENAALDEAIMRLEARFAEHAPQPAPDRSRSATTLPQPRSQPPAAASARAPRTSVLGAATEARSVPPAVAATPPGTPVPDAAAPPRPAGPPGLPTGKAPPVSPAPIRDRPVLGQRPAPPIAGESKPRPPLPPRPPPARSSADLSAAGLAGSGLPAAGVLPAARVSRPVMAVRAVAAASSDADRTPSGTTSAEAGPSAERQARAPVRGGAVPDADAPQTATSDEAVQQGPTDFADAMDAAGQAGRPRDEVAPPRGRDSSLRPAAPRPKPSPRIRWPVLAATGLVAALMFGIGIAAWTMRDRPEQVASRSGLQTSEGSAPGKTVDRANPPAGEASTPDAQAGDATSGIAVPAPVPQNSSSADTGAGIAVAQRAALLVDAPDEPQRIKTYTGTVVWHVDSVSPGQGQPLAMAVSADIDIPDAKLKVTMLLQKNPEPQLPASHTVEFHFLPQPGGTLGNVKQINVPEMRKDDDAATGDSLSGVPVAITDNYFLVGLSRGGAENQNLRLIAERNWFDVSILFVSNKLAKLTFEKGAGGQRVLEDAMKSWR